MCCWMEEVASPCWTDHVLLDAGGGFSMLNWSCVVEWRRWLLYAELIMCCWMQEVASLCWTDHVLLNGGGGFSMLNWSCAVGCRRWLQNNVSRSRQNEEAMHSVQEDIGRLCDMLHDALDLQGIRWDNVWGITHFRGCLKTFYRLYAQHPELISSVLKGERWRDTCMMEWGSLGREIHDRLVGETLFEITED